MVVTGDSKSFSLGSNPSKPTMEVTFKYNNKIITTPNLEKKLKRMKLQLSDIEIIETPIKKEKPSNDGIEDYMMNKERVIVRSKLDDIRRICYVPKGTRPNIKEFLGKQGIYTDDELMNMYYEQEN